MPGGRRHSAVQGQGFIQGRAGRARFRIQGHSSSNFYSNSTSIEKPSITIEPTPPNNITSRTLLWNTAAITANPAKPVKPAEGLQLTIYSIHLLLLRLPELDYPEMRDYKFKLSENMEGLPYKKLFIGTPGRTVIKDSPVPFPKLPNA